MRSTFQINGAVLRPLSSRDTEPIARACADPLIARWTQVPVPYTLADAEQFVASRAGEDNVWAIDADGLAGVIGLRNTRSAAPGPICEVGYWVAPWARGRGLATAALTGVRQEAEQQGFVRIDWHAIAGNLASVRVAQRAGFTIEGTRRCAMIHRGRLVDAVVGGWVREPEIPELVAGAWQVQPVPAADVPPDLRPLASAAYGVWVARTAVGGIDSGFVVAVRSAGGVHVVGMGAPDAAVAAVRRYLEAMSEPLTDEPLPAEWLLPR